MELCQKEMTHFINWQRSLQKYCNSVKRLSDNEINRSFYIRRLPNATTYRDLYFKLKAFGWVKDVLISRRSRNQRTPRFARVEFGDKKIALKFLKGWDSCSFFENCHVEKLTVKEGEINFRRTPHNFIRNDS